ncbi:unnamed protein product [Cylicostephanus goldi]|uniref:Uncharacterized protein n=1 Tax=Cylicostephanus goldi TaxID=71465 RepID=A0A3P6RL18_CYLGO|nr:unnamed protein product [Cylicostephanus goldi]
MGTRFSVGGDLGGKGDVITSCDAPFIVGDDTGMEKGDRTFVVDPPCRAAIPRWFFARTRIRFGRSI